MTQREAKLSWWNIDSWTWLLALPLGFSTSAFQVFNVDHAGFTLADVGAILFGCIAVYRALTGQRMMIWRFDVVMVLLFALYAVSLISVIPPLMSGLHDQVLQYVKSTAHFSYMWFFTVCCASIPIDSRAVLRALRTYCVLAIGVNVFGIYQVPARAFDWPLAWIQTTNVSIGGTDQLSLGYEGFFRATSVFSEPSALAFYTSLSAIFLLVPYLMFNVRILNNRFLFFASLYSTFIAMFLTFSLTTVAQLSAFVVVLLLISRQSNIRKLLMISGTVAAVIVAANWAVVSYSGTDVFELYFQRIAANVVGGDKMETTVGDSFETRATDQKAAFSIWKKAPLLGTGFGCLGFIKADDGLSYVQTHQTYLYTLATTGILGFLVILGFMISLSVRAFSLFFRYRAVHSDVDSRLLVIAVAPFIASNQLVYGLSSDNLIVSYSWVLIGIVCSVLYHPDLHQHTEGVRVEVGIDSVLSRMSGLFPRGTTLEGV